MTRALLAFLIFVAAGCASRVPYAPDRAVVRSIPPDKAHESLRAALFRADGVTGVAVEAARLDFTTQGSRFSASYAQTRVGIFTESAAKSGAGRATDLVFEPFSGSKTATTETVYVVVFEATGVKGEVRAATREDAETIVDAITSLGGDVMREER